MADAERDQQSEGPSYLHAQRGPGARDATQVGADPAERYELTSVTPIVISTRSETHGE